MISVQNKAGEHVVPRLCTNLYSAQISYMSTDLKSQICETCIVRESFYWEYNIIGMLIW